ncbi:hypothetical protein AJ79_07063 [Helicocarpus griseus UAMH5409]|uniref:Uncharacterized protein n=1 Tax=Helicocarpus griseus UAMH5409 TaxID=1447875 RepID=A0A2B7X736_9EURO|nr:hypothetical protein AJ79_07063 [Helicocarpus griseus UAMH5409]
MDGFRCQEISQQPVDQDARSRWIAFIIFHHYVQQTPFKHSMFSPFVVLSSAEEDLLSRGIPLVEYGELLDVRFGYPACVQTVKWAIPDSQLSEASSILLKHNISVVGPSELQVSLQGDWEAVGIMHHHANMRVHLVPLS